MEVVIIRDEMRALEDYLITIYRLEEVYGIAKTTDIARELDVKPATVTKMLAKLAEKGYVEIAPYKGAKLTEKGREFAEKIVRKHRIAEHFFSKVLGFSLVKSHVYAHMLEHLPDEVFDRMYEVFGRPQRCPHGNPVPRTSTATEVVEAKPLASLPRGTLAKIMRIVCESRVDLLYEVERLKLEPDVQVCVEDVIESGVSLRTDAGRVFLGIEAARIVFAKPVGLC